MDGFESTTRDTEVSLRVQVSVFAEAGIFVLKVEVLSQVCQCHLHGGFCKGLTETNAFSATKRHEYVWMSFLSRWRKVEGVIAIESIWQKFLWALPLGCELLHTLVVDDQLIVGLQVEVPYPTVLGEHHRHTIVRRILVSQCLQHDLVHVFQVLNDFKR